MRRRMMCPAKPLDVERFGVIGMMALSFRSTTDLAGLRDETATGDCNLHGDAGTLSGRAVLLESFRQPVSFGSGQRFVQRPSRFDPAHESKRGNAKFLGPCRHGLLPALKTDQPVVALIAALSLGIGPAYVAGRIVTVIVDPVEAETFRAWPHIGNESLECFKLRGDGDSAASVISVGMISRILAAAFHIIPTLILGSARLAMSAASVSNCLGATATARYGAAIDKVVCADRFQRSSALALAKPVRAPTMIGSTADHCQLAESLTGQIMKVLATASLCIAVEKIRSAHRDFIAAFAMAEPICLTFSGKRQSQYGQLTECLASQTENAPAATRDCMSSCEVSGTNKFFFSAFTSAIPAGFMATRIGSSVDYRKLAKRLAREILRYPWHKVYFTTIIGGKQVPCPAY